MRLLPILLLFPLSLDAAEPKPVDFDKDVRPIFTAHCAKCHAGKNEKGGLKLDDPKAALAGGNSGHAYVPGKSADSRLIQLVTAAKPDEVMPPGEAKKLTKDEIGVLRAWIDQGAKWGAVGTVVEGPVKSEHWAFQPIRKIELKPKKLPISSNPIDNTIRAGMETQGYKPSVEADRTTLIRRSSFDITGLPPTPKEVEEFINDTSSNAYEKLVDRLLASPHYGERWGRHWLDAARYADSDGYEKDTGRPFAWRYRDWVIDALNKDLAFDQFTIEQIAGDLLPGSTVENKTATGFHRNTLTNKEGGADQEEFRVAAVVDRVNTTGTVWLGLTVGCAQCHDHKYDPVSQREFYQLFAFYNSDREVNIAAPLPGEKEKLARQSEESKAESAKLKAAVEEAKEKNLSVMELAKREKALADFNKKAPTGSLIQTLAVGAPRKTNVLIRGDFLRKGIEVQPATPAVIPKGDAPVASRLDLARWLVSKENPLTSRVIANWIWGKYFGKGLVSTPEDFGVKGQKPSHPELLDYLAISLRDDAGWSLKKFHKLIVMSETYRQSSAVTPGMLNKDPLNVFLSRQNRLRMEAEIVRDNALSTAGLLSEEIGGPSIRPPQPVGISELTYANSAKWVESAGREKYKRGMYIWFQRTSPYPTLMTFDASESNVCIVKRERSNTPLQALALLNDVVFVEAAQALAKRVQAEEKPEKRIEHLCKLALGRSPTAAEAKRLQRVFDEARKLAEAEPAEALKLLGKHAPDKLDSKSKAEVANAAAWVVVARVMMNLDEFVTRD